MLAWTTLCWTLFLMYSVACVGYVGVWLGCALCARRRDTQRDPWPIPTTDTTL